MITGTGTVKTATSDFVPIEFTGTVNGGIVLLTFDRGTNTSITLRYVPAVSPKGNIHFLKCPENLGRTLVPEGIEPFNYDILKPELIEQAKKWKNPQQ